MISARLTILSSSLTKKESALALKLDAHFKTVAMANGQPLNDKRNGAATLRKWDKQSDGIRNALAGVEVTKQAIEREQYKIADTQAVFDQMPLALQALIVAGTVKQWRKFPHILFVTGVEKGRIYWNADTRTCSHKFVRDIPKDQYAIFRDIYNALNRSLKS